jgi:DNA-binding LacI/PurR family transcriptional regulator
MRLSPPGHLSSVTFGDSDWARACRPAVVVIRFDRYREAPRATDELLAALGARPRWRTRHRRLNTSVGNRSGPCLSTET